MAKVNMFDISSYTIGWICALSTEYVAAREFLDQEHDQADYVSAAGDQNSYTFGTIGKHHVILAVMPEGQYGTTSAATVARDMIRSFPNLKIGLMVGIGGGVPSAAHDIRLGDIVVSKPSNGIGGVYQYDYGKTVQEKEFQQTGHLNSPPTSVLTAIAKLRAHIEADGHDIDKNIEAVLLKKPRLRKKYGHPDKSTDRLYKSTFVHSGGEDDCEDSCANAENSICPRMERDADEDNPAIHYGLIASANQLMKDALIRDALAKKPGILCFEMEAAGLMDQFPFLVVRGICDYADSHKNKRWQGYAAMTAAAYAKLLINIIAPKQAANERPISEILRSIGEKLDRVEAASRSMENDIKGGVLDRWLSASSSDPSTNRNAAQDLRHHDSGLWFLQSSEYNDWKSNTTPTLWLYGILGCGKTVLSSTIIDDLENSGYTVVYFYFDFNDPAKKQSFERMLRSLIWQLYMLNEHSRMHLDQLYSSCNAGGKQPPLKSLKETFQSMIDKTRNFKIVLDALDECLEGKELLHWLASSMSRKAISILFTSRELNEIKSSLERLTPPVAKVSLQRSAVDHDIRSFVRSRLSNNSELQRRWQDMPEVLERIEMKLMEKADGMFYWVALQLNTLTQCLDLLSLNEALLSLPKNIDETYRRILRNIPDVYKPKAIRLLQFLAFTESPLRLEEAIDVIAVFPGRTPAFDESHRLRVPEEIVSYCPSLTKIVTSREKYRKGVTELHPAHFSVKEYLVSDRVDESFKAEFAPCRANAVIVEISLAYLFAVQKDFYTEEDNAAFPLLRYISTSWMTHARKAQEDKNAQAWTMKLWTAPRTYGYWLSIYVWGPGFRFSRMEPREPLYSASRCGLEKSVEQLIRDGATVDSCGPSQRSALEAAAKGGYEEIVKILLTKYAEIDVNVRQRHLNQTLLMVIVTLLNPGSVDLNAEHLNSGGYMTCNSLRYVQERIVERLLLEGADINVSSEYHGSPLQISSYGGHEKFVTLFLNKGADPNAQEGEIGTALYAAAIKGHDDIVRILLAHKADPNLQGPYTNALYAASICGRESIVQLLISGGADVNAPGQMNEELAIYADEFKSGDFEIEPDSNPLYAAADLRHKKVVRTLLVNGADVNIPGKHIASALHVASFAGCTEVVKMLLINGAHVNTCAGRFGTALHVASLAGSRDIVELLISHGADVNARGGCLFLGSKMARNHQYDSNPLHAACFGGKKKIVKMLLDNGAEVNAQGEYFGNALQAASFFGYEKIVSILINAGAEVNAHGGRYDTALRAASCEDDYGFDEEQIRGREKVVKLLLAAGARDVDQL